jgi:hypothetical protein
MAGFFIAWGLLVGRVYDDKDALAVLLVGIGFVELIVLSI